MTYNEPSTLCKAWHRISKGPKRGYHDQYDLAWSEIDNELTTGLSDARSNVTESFRTRDYPDEVVEDLGEELDPTGYSLAMPSFCAELKSLNGNIKVGMMQSSYDGALMVPGAKTVHEYMKKPLKESYDKTQAISLSYNGTFLNLYSHHATEVNVREATTIQYRQYLLYTDSPRNRLRNSRRLLSTPGMRSI